MEGGRQPGLAGADHDAVENAGVAHTWCNGGRGSPIPGRSSLDAAAAPRRAVRPARHRARTGPRARRKQVHHAGTAIP
ncbi:hypothetical protein NS354_11375 [Leucobacter chromiiresistens]|uniref:Uncharacterized protein n=1 Tax=Leucobacter chromiiresistens TaxID=1079994 RepID=A0A147ECW8_9MICO|nr:hypothetical protein NS354_11375 [Leucobacter chromiiresistens]